MKEILKTGIGSMPLVDATKNLEIIKEALPQIPHWPQMPQRGVAEHFVFQFLRPLTEVGLLQVEGNKGIFKKDETFPEKLTFFYEKYFEALEKRDYAFFAMPRESGEGLYLLVEKFNEYFPRALAVKGQMAGPLSILLTLTDENKIPAFYDPEIREAVVKTLVMSARWQVNFLKNTGRKVYLFVDDPAIANYGSFTHLTLKREEVVGVLKEIIDGILEEGGIPGVHSCAGIDWSIVTEAGAQVVSVDAYNYLDSLFPYKEEIKSLLNTGGILALGIIPTGPEIENYSLEDLYKDYEQKVNLLREMGVVSDNSNIMLTPACGTGLLLPEHAEKIYGLLRDFGKEITND
ncbi:methionine synthase [Carboxydothermus ferrireducens]|uniref:Methionine synthase II (Cobalamin-independent) n=1 Tax=Carboxydothermus ferrireducens DSM 11255 TaxID=1119529 RepID=A0ABX2RCB6_9THEO|nr:methionine synthase [Carboxydothermus ferrireducens]NYE58799.1 hypothetical protein [Carboxydothermus ferrireducens DSM 11255]